MPPVSDKLLEYRHNRKTRWKFRTVRIRFDDGWSEVMKDVSCETGIPYDDIERIVSAWWRWVSEMMSRPELPRIRMMYLGELYPVRRALYDYCEKMSLLIETLHRKMLAGSVEKPVGDIRKMEKHLLGLQDTHYRIAEEYAELEVRKQKKKDKDWDHRRFISPRIHRARDLKAEIARQNKESEL